MSWLGTAARSPRLPRIDDRNSPHTEILHISGDDCEVMVLCRSCHEAIDDGQRDPFKLCFAGHRAPNFRNFSVDWQEAIRKADRQIDLQPSLQLSALAAGGQERRALADLSKRKDAEVEQHFICDAHPVQNTGFGFDAHQFRNAIGIEQKPAHSSMSRPVSLSRSKSSSRPTSGDSRKNSTRLFLG